MTALTEAVRQMREKFEKWADDQGFILDRTIHGNDYQDLRTQGPWDAYQAAYADLLAEPAAPQAEPSDTALAQEMANARDDQGEDTWKYLNRDDRAMWEAAALRAKELLGARHGRS